MSMRQRQATQRGTVCIIASVKAPELNGATGTCVRWVCYSDRWEVRLQDGCVKALKGATITIDTDDNTRTTAAP